ncbi:MAG: histidine kinase dimerization/phospho-acceptor domain-containing protein, partial [Pseudomonadota bacterium]
MKMPSVSLQHWSLNTRMLAIFIGGVLIAQLLYLVLDTSIRHAHYHKLMKERAIEKIALQVAALVEDPSIALPLRGVTIPVSRRSRVWTGDINAFDGVPIQNDPELAARYQDILSARGFIVKEVLAAYVKTAVRTVNHEGRERFAGSRALPSETYIAIRLDGYQHWINGVVASYAAPDPLTTRHIALNLAILALVGGSGAALMRRGVSNALSDLQQAAESVGRAGAPPAPLKGPNEFHDAIDALNCSRRRVAELLDQKNVMLGALSHEIRTPLTSIRLRLENFEPSLDRDRAIGTIEEMTRLLDEILELAREGRYGIRLGRYDLSAIIADV